MLSSRGKSSICVESCWPTDPRVNINDSYILSAHNHSINTVLLGSWWHNVSLDTHLKKIKILGLTYCMTDRSPHMYIYFNFIKTFCLLFAYYMQLNAVQLIIKRTFFNIVSIFCQLKI